MKKVGVTEDGMKRHREENWFPLPNNPFVY